jgi:phage FluMu protein Com
MPIRDWKCTECPNILRDVHFNKESEVELPVKCPKCKKKTKWKRLAPLSNFVMK